MDIRNFFSRKRKSEEDNDKCIAPAKKKRKVCTNGHNKNIQNESTIDTARIQENSEEKCDIESDSMEQESNDDDDIIANNENTNKKKKRESVTISKSKQNSIACSLQYDVVRDCGFNGDTPLQYVVIAELFDKLGATTKRLEKIEILSRLFRSILHCRCNKSKNEKDNSLLYCVYLCCNEIAPPYDGVELGIGDSIIMKALCESTGRKVRDIKTEYTNTGDLGDVAVVCRAKQHTLFKPKPLSVENVFLVLKKIATTTGSGTQQEKVRNIQRLFVAAQSSESRYIVRHLQGKLRIGVNEQTVLCALGRALAFDALGIVDPSNESKNNNIQRIADLEAQYTAMIKMAISQVPNYEMVIGALIRFGIEDLKHHCHLTAGVPIKAMLAKPTKGIKEILKRFQDLRFTLEYKYDGERAQIHLLSDGTIKIFSRNAEDNTTKFPELIESVKRFKNDDIKSFIIDSEIVAYDRVNDTILPFATLITRKRKNVSASDVTVSVCIYAFDCLLINDEPLISLPFNQRRAALHDSFKEVSGEFCFAHHRDTCDAEEISQYLSQAVTVGKCEGLMIKTLEIDATYEPSKRSHSWLKCKKDYLDGVGDTLDLVVMGAYHGTGKRTGAFGSYLVGCYDDSDDVFQSVSKVATGFKDVDLINLDKEMKSFIVAKKPLDYDTSYDCEVWFEPKMVWELKCADLTISPTHSAANGLAHESKGIALRFPRFVRKREDKSATCASTANQIYEMYCNQAILN